MVCRNFRLRRFLGTKIPLYRRIICTNFRLRRFLGAKIPLYRSMICKKSPAAHSGCRKSSEGRKIGRACGANMSTKIRISEDFEKKMDPKPRTPPMFKSDFENHGGFSARDRSDAPSKLHAMPTYTTLIPVTEKYPLETALCSPILTWLTPSSGVSILLL